MLGAIYAHSLNSSGSAIKHYGTVYTVSLIASPSDTIPIDQWNSTFIQVKGMQLGVLVACLVLLSQNERGQAKN